MKELKPVRWMGSSREDVRKFPKSVRRLMGFAIDQAQRGGRSIDAKPLKGFGGAGVLEVVAADDGCAYRGVYTVRLTGIVYVLHAFQKKSKSGRATPKYEIELVKRRLREAELDYMGSF